MAPGGPLDAAGPSETSNLNVNGPGQTRAAAAVVKVTTVGAVRGFKVWSYGGGHVIVDVAGYYTGSSSANASDGLFVPMVPQRILDTRKPGAMGRLWPGWMVEMDRFYRIQFAGGDPITHWLTQPTHNVEPPSTVFTVCVTSPRPCSTAPTRREVSARDENRPRRAA